MFNLDYLSISKNKDLKNVVPLVFLVAAIILHLALPNKQVFKAKSIYLTLLLLFLAAYTVILILSHRNTKIREVLTGNSPLLALFVFLFSLWDTVTLKLFLLPLPYFPAPDRVLNIFLTDWRTLGISVFHSMRLLILGYLIGASLGFVAGILLGWWKSCRYWVMPFIRIIGPVPAVTWIPIAMVVFPTSFMGSVFIIALAVWFPVTIMTFSGISSVRNSYFEVASTLGANEPFLILRVAIPAAFPSIFIGLWQATSASFISLIVAEMMGVKAGLGWYITWATSWAEYAKVYAVLIIIAIIFSNLIKLLFKLRDKVLIWQKGLIKW